MVRKWFRKAPPDVELAGESVGTAGGLPAIREEFEAPVRPAAGEWALRT
jgi:hypothetical protein